MTEDVFGIVGNVIAGTYQVEQVVAEGGFGVVYRAHHVGFRAPVALKCLKIPQQLSAAHQDEFLEQFRAEAELLFRLSSSIPTVVRPLHVDAVTLENGLFVPFMALEWLEGETLEAIMERRKAQGLPPLSLKKLTRLLTPVARALEKAHNFYGPEGPISVVHRDMKPENIFVANVAGEEIVKILDFGIGKAKSVASQVAGRASQSHSSFTSFTPAYGAPEQWVPKRYGQTGPWTDVWGLALTLVEVMAGRTIVDGDHAAMMGTVLDAERRPTPRSEGVAVSDEVEAVFLKALAVDPRDRYPDAGKFWNDLTEAAGVRGEARQFQPRARDARAEGGFVPRVEHVEAANTSSSLPPRELRAAREAETLAGDALSVPAVPEVAALVDIPDLAPAPNSSRPQSSRKPDLPPVSGEFDLDEAPALDLALDLAPGERPSMRAPAPGRGSGTFAAAGSSSRIPAVGGSGTAWPAAGRERPASGANWPAPSPDRPPSGANWPVPSPDRPPSGANWPVPSPDRPASGANWPAVTDGEPRRASGAHHPAVVDSGSAPRRISGAGWPAADPSGAPPPVSSPMHSPPPDVPSAPRWAMPEAPRAVPEPDVSLARRLAPGIVLLAASIVITVADQVYASSSGEVLTIASLRAGWIAGTLMLAGVIWLGLGLARHFRR